MSKPLMSMDKKSIRRTKRQGVLKLTLLLVGCAFLLKSDRSRAALRNPIDNK
ncbi:hypothetical protein F952_02748 [Acinetobacter baylyi DSM 14961 = CIP 107474]|nr:hypothetical protein F952_02748 [Acinetobacter baylyi DSM 14961 = CIP 107474]